MHFFKRKTFVIDSQSLEKSKQNGEEKNARKGKQRRQLGKNKRKALVFLSSAWKNKNGGKNVKENKKKRKIIMENRKEKIEKSNEKATQIPTQRSENILREDKIANKDETFAIRKDLCLFQCAWHLFNSRMLKKIKKDR